MVDGRDGLRRDKRSRASTRTSPRVRERAEQLTEQGMPYQMAMAVAHGRMDLNDALERMARRDRVKVLMDRHGLSRALATQIVIGHADLNQVLARRRLAEHRQNHRDRTCLESGSSLTLALMNGRTLRGEVGTVEPYTFTFVSGDETTELHKLKVKYAYDPQQWKKVKKGVRSDGKKSAEGAVEPAERPQDRYSCSDRRLFGYLDTEQEVFATLLGGDLLRGRVTWFSRYEFGLQLRSQAEVTVFRHALKNLVVATSQTR
ncbi:MAG: hypothetical protein AAGA48_15390 [Myxococcota bacterium]